VHLHPGVRVVGWRKLDPRAHGHHARIGHPSVVMRGCQRQSAVHQHQRGDVLGIDVGHVALVDHLR